MLALAAQVIKSNIRDVDVVARFGGDEFALILPETTAEAAQVVLSRIKVKLLDAAEKYKSPVTFSFGVVTFLKAPDSVEEMIKRVGTVMYSAKNAGANTIEQEVFCP